MLRNRIYLGEMRWGVSSQRLGAKLKKMPREQWEYKKDVLAPIVEVGLFDRVQARLDLRRHSPEDMLADLRVLYEKHGRITTRMLGIANGTAGYLTYVRTFGSVQAACEKAGVADKMREKLLNMLRMFAKGRTHIYAGPLDRARG
jgi:hypothetical protein